MSISAIVMMVISLVVVWGGLLAAVVHLRRHPGISDDDLHLSDDMQAEDERRARRAPLQRDT
ncbi:methionine/alanine import family NSS transporter small subunit [Enemella sp. A6]|uniref:methionine/alanine import family NSS transporter small subunit n=1 Tax=Enemella sp. A6 TaxID=3440152 RepID=UPI003EC13B17